MFVLRFLGGLVMVSLATLTVVQPTTRVLWAASVAATEWGTWLALASLLVLIPTRDRWRLGRLGTVMGLAAIGLFVAPVVRAKQLNETLPFAIESNFGGVQRARHSYAEPARKEPLNLTELLNPVKAPPVRYEERVFAAHDGQNLSIGLYRPAYVHEAVPVILVVHGGTWRDGDRREFASFNAYLASRDYVVAAMDYRLAPQWRFPAARDDVLTAIAFLKVYAREIGIDASRIALLGRSGGGQLALLAAYTAQEPAIKGVISLYGSSDLRAEYENPAPPKVRDTRAALEAYLGGAPGSASDDAYYAASPVNFVNPSAPPTLLVHGERDPIVSAGQTSALESRLQKAGVKNLFVRLPWATHGCELSYGGPCGQIVSYAVERFLDSVMAGPPPAKAAPGPVRKAAPARARTAANQSAKKTT
jgi:acetyl esterase/lipase